MDSTRAEMATQRAPCPFHPDDAATIENPYTGYEYLRRETPVAYLRDHDLWVVSRHVDVVEVLRDPLRFSSRLGMARQPGPHAPRATDYRIGAPGVRVLIATDPPEHTMLRAAASAPFRTPAIARLTPRIEDIARRLVTDLLAAQDRGDADTYRDLAAPLPVLVLAELFGVPPEMRTFFREWSSTIVDDLRAPGLDPDHADAEVRLGRGYEMFRYFWQQIRSRRAHPRDDVLSVLAATERSGLSDHEIMAFCAFLLVAGIETTTNLLTNVIDALIRFPDVQRRLWEDPGLADAVVEETLRFDTSVQGLWRATTEPLQVGGVSLPAGARMLVLFGSANHDEAVFPEPAKFVLGRRANPHLAFGSGPHRCLGARLAKLELTAALRSLVAATSGIERRGPFLRTGSLVLRGFVGQPVTLTPR